MYNVLLVAKYVIKHCNENGMPVSNLKLQKLLYFIQAQFLVNTGNPCFPEDIEAWNFGPVVPEVYKRYKPFGSSNIPYMNSSVVGRITPADREMIDDIVDKCAKYSAAKLVEITHRQRPWLQAYSPYRNNVISKKSIYDFFSD